MLFIIISLNITHEQNIWMSRNSAVSLMKFDFSFRRNWQAAIVSIVIIHPVVVHDACDEPCFVVACRYCNLYLWPKAMPPCVCLFITFGQKFYTVIFQSVNKRNVHSKTDGKTAQSTAPCRWLKQRKETKITYRPYSNFICNVYDWISKVILAI